MSVMGDLLGCNWGQQLLSDYHVVKSIHISPMSEVFALESGDGRQRLILKAMKPNTVSQTMLEILKTVPIEGVVPICDYYLSKDYAYVIKPYIEGISLQDYMEHGLSIDGLLNLIKQLVQIIINCHSHSPAIILRDIKPDNLIIQQGKLGILDMESSKLKGPTYPTTNSTTNSTANRDTVLLGTPGYAAPEQYGFQISDERTDIYAIGQVMNSLLERVLATHKAKAFMGNFLEKPLIWSARKISKRATAFDPQMRFQSAQSFKKSLDGIYPKIYMTSMSVCILVMAMIIVGFKLPPILDHQQVQVLQKAEISKTESTTSAPTVLPLTPSSLVTLLSPAVPLSPLTTLGAPSPIATPEITLAAPASTPLVTIGSVPTSTPPVTIPTTQGTPTKVGPLTVLPNDAPAITTPSEPTVTATEKNDVRFSGSVSYSAQLSKCYFLIMMTGITDPFYKNQFGSPVNLSSGADQYTDINRSTLVTGERYMLTGYLDLNGNFILDPEEPSEVINQWTFSGKETQTVDFNNLIKDAQVKGTQKEETPQTQSNEKNWMPGVYHLHKPESKLFKTTAYRSQMDPNIKDFDAFTVLGTNTAPSQATEFLARLVAQGELKGLAYASPSKDYQEFNSVDGYVDNHMVVFIKADKLLGYVQIVDGKALPSVVYKP